MDPGQISIQKLSEARENLPITKQRRHIFLAGTKTINAYLQVLQVVKFA